MSTTTTSTEETWVHYHDGGIPGRRKVLTGITAKPTFNELPRIDFKRIYSDKLSDRQELAKEVGAACRDVGFFHAVNHGVEESLLDETFDALKKFFDLPTEVKMEVHNQKTPKFRGYEAFLEGKLDPSTRGDLKEGFLMGEDATDFEQRAHIDPSTTEPRNQWPTHPSALFWRPAIYRYYSAMYAFSKRLLGIFALALDLPEDAFDVAESNDSTKPAAESAATELRYAQYEGDKEEQYLPSIRSLIGKDLSEPYSIYVYRYFLYQWGDLCFMALDNDQNLIGVIISKLEPHRSGTYRGYIAMLAVQESHRGKGIASKLVSMAIDAMAARDADEIVLETEITNTASLKLYERLGFLRSKKLHRYYLNGNAAYRLILYLKEGTALKRPEGGHAHDMGMGMPDMQRMEDAGMIS